MARDYNDVQLLRSLVDQVGNEGDSSADQTVLDLIQWLHSTATGEGFDRVFDIIAKNYTTNLWDFEEN